VSEATEQTLLWYEKRPWSVIVGTPYSLAVLRPKLLVYSVLATLETEAGANMKKRELASFRRPATPFTLTNGIGRGQAGCRLEAVS
jgi:hypothetical protein